MANRTCTFTDCDKPRVGHGLCSKHYQRQRRGEPLDDYDIGSKFLEFGYSDSDGCWPWRGSVNARGYGRLVFSGISIYAHRLSYALHHGDLPVDAFICHVCDNPICCNPAHLYAGTPADNMDDKVERDRQWHPAGSIHPGAKLSEQDVLSIRELHLTGQWTQKDLASRFRVSPATVYGIVHRRQWKHI